MKKLLILAVLTLGIVGTSFSQSKKIEKKASELVEKLNSEIEKGDKTLGLTDDQKKTS